MDRGGYVWRGKDGMHGEGRMICMEREVRYVCRGEDDRVLEMEVERVGERNAVCS